MPTSPNTLHLRAGGAIEQLESRIAPAAALSLAFTSDAGTRDVAHGQVVTYTLTVTNTGDATANNVALQFTLPTAISIATDPTGDGFSSTGTDGVYSGAVGTLGEGASTSKTFHVQLNNTFGYNDSVIVPTSVKILETEAVATFNNDEGIPPLGPTPAGTSPADKILDLPVYQGIYVLSSGIAKNNELGPSDLRVFDISTGKETLDFRAYPNVNGHVVRDSFRVALADFNGDGYDDIVVSTAHGTGPIKIFNGETGALMYQITPFNGRGGLFVAAGDVTGDGVPDIVVGSALGGGALAVIDGSTRQYIGQPIHPFGPNFHGAVRVAVADFEGPEGGIFRFNNYADEIVAAQGNFGNQIKVYSLSGPNSYTQRAAFTVGGPHYRGGLNIAAGDLDGDGVAEIVAGRNRLSSPTVDVFKLTLDTQDQLVTPAATTITTGPISILNDLDASMVQSFDAFSPSFKQGVRVSIGDVDADGNVDILCTAGYSGGSKARLFSGSLKGGYTENQSFGELTVFDRPLPATWSAITDLVPSMTFVQPV